MNKESSTNKKAVGYIRVSTVTQAEEGESLEIQRKSIRDFVGQKGWKLTNIYADEGLSGATTEHRKQFQQMIADAKDGQFEFIVFYKLSRFARNAIDFLNIQRDLKPYDVQLISIKEYLDPTTAAGRMFTTFMAGMAEWDKDNIREQLSAGKSKKWKDRRTFIGAPPYGYYKHYEREDGKKVFKGLKEDPHEAPIYKRVVSMYVDKLMSYNKIVIQLKKEGIKSRMKDFTSTHIGDMFKNTAYYGHSIVNKYKYEFNPDTGNWNRSKHLKPASEWINFPFPALISKTRWDAIQRRTADNKTRTKRTAVTTADFMLRDFLVCGRCGAKVVANNGYVRKDETAERYYRCYWRYPGKSNLLADDHKQCTLPTIPAKKIEAAVWSDILVMLALNPDRAYGDMFNPEKHKKAIEKLGGDEKRLETKLGVKERAKKRVDEMLDDDRFDKDEYIQKKLEFKDEIIGIQANLGEVREKLQHAEELHKQEKEAQEFITKNKEQLKRIRKDVNNLKSADKKLLVEGMLSDQPVVEGMTPGKAVVNYQNFDPKHPEDGEGPSIDFRLKFNPEIIQRLVDEGKIKLDKNSSLPSGMM